MLLAKLQRDASLIQFNQCSKPTPTRGQNALSSTRPIRTRHSFNLLLELNHMILYCPVILDGISDQILINLDTVTNYTVTPLVSSQRTRFCGPWTDPIFGLLNGFELRINPLFPYVALLLGLFGQAPAPLLVLMGLSSSS